MHIPRVIPWNMLYLSLIHIFDEDTSATNFMVRDELMQRVIHRDMEPITPFIERVRDCLLYTSRKREHYEKPSVRRKKKSEAARKRKYN